MNHCVLEVDVLQAPTLRYTQDNQTPIAEMDVGFDALRPDDPRGQLKVVGWGNLAQDLQNRVQVGQRLLIEGRLRMNTVPRQDGTKEKRAEFTLSRLHAVGATPSTAQATPSAPQAQQASQPTTPQPAASQPPASEPAAQWNSAPLVPDTDDIPF
ncbi:MAG: single-stranded DNA-binding protein [Synechococcus sp. BS301-5m-G53]|nr:single-stranded DNA-binding protein [Synechococcus sp. BS301-5m-G53]